MMYRRRALTGAGTLAVVVLALAGCGAPSSAAIIGSPAPTIAPPPTPLPMSRGVPGVHALMKEFDEAVLLRAVTLARSYLTATLALRNPNMVLPNTLGIQGSIPQAARYTVVRIGDGTATVDVTYTLANGSVSDRLALVYVGKLWRIASIRRL